jgi:hypothetical protein
VYATYDRDNYIHVQVYFQVYVQVHAHFDQLQSEQWSKYQHLYHRDDKHLEDQDKHLQINAWVCTDWYRSLGLDFRGRRA